MMIQKATSSSCSTSWKCCGIGFLVATVFLGFIAGAGVLYLQSKGDKASMVSDEDIAKMEEKFYDIQDVDDPISGE